MDFTRFPVQIATQKLMNPDLDIYYPAVIGLPDAQVQQRIISAIYDMVVSLLVKQGYYQNPGAEVSGWYEIKTNERGILSLSLGNYIYITHAAHGMTVIKSLTFDIVTGKSYSLADLFKPGSDYVKVLSGIVERQIKERDIMLLEDFKGIKSDQDYYIADKALVLYFQLYELTAYAYGFPYFPISVYDIEDIIDEQGPLGKMMGSF